jgi:beta-lactamase regulating signal transducer with metallopeptidase domain
MTNDILEALIRLNLVAAAGVLAVLAVRGTARRLFGAEIAYGLWVVPPLAALATLMPAPIAQDAPAAGMTAAVATAAGPLLAVWIAGVVAAVAVLAWTQARFLAAARAGKAGPAVVGVVTPRIVMPADEGAFTAQERELIRAHERTHIVRGDPKAGALAAALQALCWFNPLVHLGVRAMRLDQELACDAAVLRARPRDRTLYARTLLKSQLAAQGLPLGCCWLARGRHPLEVRVGALAARDVRRDSLAGPLLLSSAILASAWSGWRMNPPDPPPAAMVEFWKAQHKPVMSVMLIAAPVSRR